jgi:hypothetical protein
MSQQEHFREILTYSREKIPSIRSRNYTGILTENQKKIKKICFGKEVRKIAKSPKLPKVTISNGSQGFVSVQPVRLSARGFIRMMQACSSVTITASAMLCRIRVALFT